MFLNKLKELEDYNNNKICKFRTCKHIEERGMISSCLSYRVCNDFRDVFRTRSDIYNGDILKKSSIVDVRLGSKYTLNFNVL